MDPSQNQYLENLKSRLAEAEETLGAIYRQEADALLVAGPDGDQVFTLKGAETAYRLLVEAMNEGALTLSPEGTILYCNARFAEMAGCPMEQLTGSTWHRFFAPGEQVQVKALLEGSGNSGRKNEFTLQTAGGSVLPVHLSARPVNLAGVEAFAVLVTDIAELREAQKALLSANSQLERRVQERTAELQSANEVLRLQMGVREKIEESLVRSQNEERSRRMEMEALMESAPAMIWISHDPECRRLTPNRAAQEMLRLVNGDRGKRAGVEPEGASSHSAANGKGRFLATEDLPIRRAARKGQPLLGEELEVQFQDGSCGWIYGNSIPLLHEDGTLRGAISAFIDITERKAAEQALGEAQEKLRRHADDLEQRVLERTTRLQETVEELEAFSYSVSHDLRTPMRSIHSFSQLLLEECAPKLSVEEVDYLRRMVSSAKHLDRLIQEMLAFSRTARAEMPLKLVDLDKLARETIEQNPMFQEPEANIKIEGALPAVLGHEASLIQCISNLLENAVKFVAPGTMPSVKVRAEMIGTEARIWFEDNGIGIAESDHARIFSIFERVHAAEEYSGTGIGLSIVKKAVERMRGKVGVVSGLGLGSRFWIQLSGGTSL
ncbi:MAG: hypothetical protein JWR26_2402 [Pedosphaera sp.]|nr:hypothetical protein [Pedosphaera sp.]